MNKYCPLIKKKCIKDRCICWDKECANCSYFSGAKTFYKLDNLDDIVEILEELLRGNSK